jgi:PAS domain S-box-containing protein
MAAIQENGSANKGTPNPLKILIIDDEAADREIFKLYLELGQPGAFVFAEEATGRAGLARLQSFRPDCVLLDFNLPDIDGLEMIRHLSEGREFLSCAVVMMTAIGSEQIAVEAMKLGVMDYLVKGPASSETLPRTVASAVQRFRLQEQVARQRIALGRRNVELEAIRAELFEEKERYRTLTEAIPQLVWTADSDGLIRFANKRLQEYSGRGSDEVWPLALLIHPDDRSGFLDAWDGAVRSHRTFESEVRLRRAHDETFRWHLLRATPIRAAGESAFRWFGTFTDLEDQKRSEEALRQRQKLDSIGLLAGGVAHDFNNLLVGIMGGASFALDTLEAGHPARSMLEIVVRSSERAAHLTQQLLAYAGKGKTFIEPVSVPRIVHDTCELVRASVPKVVEIVEVADPGVPMIETNASQMQQIAMNLVINAAEAIGDESGTVTVGTGRENVAGSDAGANVLGYAVAPGEYVFIEVRDSGAGMDERTLARIFDPFFTTKFTGRGLGLAAVYGIVRSLGGAIEVRSAVGKGSTFRVLIPARKPHGEPAPPRAFGAGGRATAILVVDDEEVVRNTARSALERDGHEVLTAAGGAEALEIFEENSGRIGLILLDMSMPGMSGGETLADLRKLSAWVPVAILSGYSEQEISAQFGGVHVQKYIQKPFTAASLADAVGAILAAAGETPERASHGTPV